MHREKLLNLAHDSLTGGHFSHRKTSLQVFQIFFWPGASADIKRYCKSCHDCQKVSAKCRVPMKGIPILAEPFSTVAIDIVEPIHYVLTEATDTFLYLMIMQLGSRKLSP